MAVEESDVQLWRQELSRQYTKSLVLRWVF